MAFWIPVILGAWFVYDLLDIGSYLVTGDGILENVLGNGNEVAVQLITVPGLSWSEFFDGHWLALSIVAMLCLIGLYVLIRPSSRGARRTKRRGA